MEFVDGITTCSDCGGPLVPSKEEWLKEKAIRDEEEKKKKEAELQEEIAALEAEGENAEGTAKPALKRASVYEPTRQRVADVKSSRNAFALIGGIALAAGILCFAGVIPLPMAGMSRFFFETVVSLLGIAMLLYALKSQNSLKALIAKADEEEKQTTEILDWFRKTYTADAIDEKLLAEEPNLEGGELDLRRNQLISDLLVTNRDLPDQNYADYLTEQIMNEYFL